MNETFQAKRIETEQAKRREIEMCRKKLATERLDAWWRGYLEGNIRRLEREIEEDAKS